MELIETEEEKKQAALAEPEPRYKSVETGRSDQTGQSGLRVLGVILVAIILIILIVLLARWIYHSTHHNAVTGTTASHTSSLKVENGQESGTQSSGNSSDNSSSSSGSSSSGSSSSNSNNSTSSSTQISNTGPGDTAAIFAGVTLAAAGAHYVITSRRPAKSS